MLLRRLLFIPLAIPFVVNAQLSKGNSFKLTAELQLSIDTVRTHIKHAYEKVQVHSQTEAVYKAINEKIV